MSPLKANGTNSSGDYRNIEHVDAEIGRILQALQDCGYSKDTMIVLTSDHGEGLAHHQMVRKNTLYDEASRVPLLFSWPGHISENITDSTHPVSGLDIMPTLCDYVGIKPPENIRGSSLRSILEGTVPARNFTVTEVSSNTGRMIRTPSFKYITYKDDSVEQLFDMKTDPDETKNLLESSRHASVLTEHRKILKDWESRLDVPVNVPNADFWRHRG